MRIRRRAILLLLPALYLFGPSAVVAAPSPSPDLHSGEYIGLVTMTALHSGSTTVTGASVSWSIDMVESVGTIDISVNPLGTYFISVDMPVPIDYQNTAKISDKASKCKGYTVTGSGYGRATGKGASLAPHTATGAFTMARMGFALSSMSARIKKNGECPSQTWGSEARTAIDADFTAIFGSQWTFTVVSPGPASLAGTCESATFGKAKGQVLSCGWRAYRITSK
jgi:hypothetical protein